MEGAGDGVDQRRHEVRMILSAQMPLMETEFVNEECVVKNESAFKLRAYIKDGCLHMRFLLIKRRNT
jgi:hypothetical protein